MFKLVTINSRIRFYYSKWRINGQNMYCSWVSCSIDFLSWLGTWGNRDVDVLTWTQNNFTNRSHWTICELRSVQSISLSASPQSNKQHVISGCVWTILLDQVQWSHFKVLLFTMALFVFLLQWATRKAADKQVQVRYHHLQPRVKTADCRKSKTDTTECHKHCVSQSRSKFIDSSCYKTREMSSVNVSPPLRAQR